MLIYRYKKKISNKSARLKSSFATISRLIIIKIGLIRLQTLCYTFYKEAKAKKTIFELTMVEFFIGVNCHFLI